MGWVAMIVLALAIGLGLRFVGGLRGAVLQLAAAALLVAMAGYAWQGRPEMPGQPRKAAEREALPESAYAILRPAFSERFDYASRWLIIADGYQRRGNSRDAVGIIRAGLRARPDNAALWTGLGNALAIHGGGRMNPAADLAYRRAMTLAPRHPAPAFFYGLSLVQSGEIEQGERIWRRLLATAPATASWRPLVTERLAIIDQLRAAGRLPPARSTRPGQAAS